MAQDKFSAGLSSLQADHPIIRLYTPGSSEDDSLRKTYIISQAKQVAIAQPQTVDDVQALVRTFVENGLKFNIRTGDHNAVGRTLVNDFLLIDMRDISGVTVSKDNKTARIGGGILVGGLLKALGEHGLVTPCGSVASVGYVGWSSNGGYGAFSSLHGLGVDQILGAKLVNHKGDLMLVSTLIYESSDMQSVWKSLTEGLERFTLPPALQLQMFATDFPGRGRVLAAIVTWVNDDHEEGRKFVEQVASFGNCVVNMTEAKTASKCADENEKLVYYGVYGRSYTLNLKKWTPTSVSTLAKYSHSVPGRGAMVSIHSLRALKPNEDSVFGAREDHHMVEIVSMTSDPTLKEETAAWGQGLLRKLKEHDGPNILDSPYISLLDSDDAKLEKIYGRHLETLVSLKRKYDPENVFKHSAPKTLA